MPKAPKTEDWALEWQWQKEGGGAGRTIEREYSQRPKKKKRRENFDKIASFPTKHNTG